MATSSSDPRFAIIQWSDNFTNIINLESVKEPRKEVKNYVEGEYISALYGKTLYRARISQISEDRLILKALEKNGVFPILHPFEEEKTDLCPADEKARGGKLEERLNSIEKDLAHLKNSVKGLKRKLGHETSSYKKPEAAANPLEDLLNLLSLMNTKACIFTNGIATRENTGFGAHLIETPKD